MFSAESNLFGMKLERLVLTRLVYGSYCRLVSFIVQILGLCAGNYC